MTSQLTSSVLLVFVLNGGSSYPQIHWPEEVPHVPSDYENSNEFNYVNYGVTSQELEDSSRSQNQTDLCSSPHSTGQYYYYAKTGECHMTGYQGPCATGTIFTPRDDFPGDSIGECQCPQYTNKGLNYGRPQIYDVKDELCIPLYTQGTCERGYWLTGSEEGYKCSINSCILLIEDNYWQGEGDWIIYNDRCVKLGSATPNCNADEVVGFQLQELSATCVNPKNQGVASYAIGGLRSANCGRGKSRSRTGKCVKNYFWKS